ncbi:unnamed protein product [Rotaria sordida]|uniref:NAD(P)(+)--arginine ADP-ribosyltransferase n=1 Tax=Rotaria sordida TaxID=392033 RepID=A0A813S0Y3_9BILA|nr:unnamed protein product [Rotaria sordida]CAF3663158.1 unnamed protein product [Rotaria sordida]
MNSGTIAWYYQSELNPWPNISTIDANLKQWTKYRDLEIDLIEEAYQEKKSHVILDRYRIDFKHFIQINLNDETKQRPVKRETISNRIECLRENRFGSTISITSSSSSSYGKFDAWCPFLIAWLHSSSGKQAFVHFPKCIEKCAEGIIKEATLHDSHSHMEARYMAEKLRQYSKKSRIEIAELCIHFYTKDSFLYFVLNKALREHDCSKLETLGPLCYLMRNYSRLSQDYIGTVYRGVQLTYTEIEAHKRNIGEWKTWPAYTSTSKDRQMAEIFGNTLFIIEITDVKLSSPRAYDIAYISNYPNEKEVLIPAGVSFQILNFAQDASQKYIINVKV